MGYHRNIKKIEIDKIFHEVMGGKFQQNWLHSIEKAKGEVGTRISFTFRYHGKFFITNIVLYKNVRQIKKHSLHCCMKSQLQI